MIRLAPLLLLALVGCEQPRAAALAAPQPGARLERAAIAAGLVEDERQVDPAGVYASDSDRVCIAPAEQGYRVAAAVDYGEGQACAARGSVTGRSRLTIDFGEGCRFDARLAGGRLTFAANLPAACDSRCTGRASLATLVADRLSGSAAEAAAFRDATGATPCG